MKKELKSFGRQRRIRKHTIRIIASVLLLCIVARADDDADASVKAMIRSSGVARALIGQGLSGQMNDPDRLTVVACGRAFKSDDPNSGIVGARSRSMSQALFKAKRKIATLKALNESGEDRLGGCRLLDCEWTEDSGGTAVSACVTVEWTKERQNRSQNEARGDFTEEIADVLEKQFLSPSFSRIEIHPAEETNLIGRLSENIRIAQAPLSRYGYFAPDNLGSFLREYVPVLATNRYDREGKILAEADGGSRTTPVDRKQLAIRALQGSSENSGWKALRWDDAKTAEWFSSVSGTNDLESVRTAIETVARTLSKPPADEWEWKTGVLAYLDEREFLGPFDWLDRKGFLHHLGCGMVPLDDSNVFTKRKFRKQAVALAEEFARFPLLASVPDGESGKERKAPLANSDCRMIPVFKAEAIDSVSGEKLTIAIVEATY